ncbi:MAG: DUF1080 domain-containing protein [Bryobacterales bacterium]|nr:DUF1080 domain-containing protein [Bryobacterales bacterium]
MKRIWMVLAAAAVILIPALSQRAASPFAGRWDMTAGTGSEAFPSWMEVVEKDGELQARVQGRTGNVNPAAAVERAGARLIVTVTAAVPERPAEGDRPATPGRPALVWELAEKGGRLTGTQTRGEEKWPLTGVRAPALQRAAPAAWGPPEPLFNGKDLTGWIAINNTPEAIAGAFKNNWVVRGGELINEARGSNLRTTRTFEDFKLHAEYDCPPGSNSGIYLRGRYEVQVGPPPQPARTGGQAATPARAAGERRGAVNAPPRNPFLGVGCVYGMAGPSSPPPFRPDWQTYDITLVGRRVTVVFNGVTTIDNQEIAGITGGALDSNEAEPGPIYLQGDHPGSFRFRNITISLPKR